MNSEVDCKFSNLSATLAYISRVSQKRFFTRMMDNISTSQLQHTGSWSGNARYGKFQE